MGLFQTLNYVATNAWTFAHAGWSCVEDGTMHIAHACWLGMHASNLHFCLYGALACAALFQAWHAWRDNKHHHAREHGLAGLVHAFMAILQIHP